jgi:hypothetical protein
VTITVRGGKIVFPRDKGQAKKILQYLNEEIFRGAITNNIYETNSKKTADEHHLSERISIVKSSKP